MLLCGDQCPDGAYQALDDVLFSLGGVGYAVQELVDVAERLAAHKGSCPGGVACAVVCQVESSCDGVLGVHMLKDIKFWSKAEETRQGLLEVTESRRVGGCGSCGSGRGLGAGVSNQCILEGAGLRSRHLCGRLTEEMKTVLLFHFLDEKIIHFYYSEKESTLYSCSGVSISGVLDVAITAQVLAAVAAD